MGVFLTARGQRAQSQKEQHFIHMLRGALGKYTNNTVANITSGNTSVVSHSTVQGPIKTLVLFLIVLYTASYNTSVVSHSTVQGPIKTLEFFLIVL